MWYLSQNLSHMVSDSNYKRLEYWVEECQSNVKLAFSLAELKQSFQ